MPKLICPKHGYGLVPQNTQYGIRYACPATYCTVVCWDGSTSTPADYDTRQARLEAHNAFDQLWKSGTFKRKEAYRQLAKYLGIAIRNTHIGRFDKDTALKVCDFAENILAKDKPND